MNVCPTNSGTTVQARAQVLIGSFVPTSFCFWTFRNSFGFTNGPFFSDLPMVVVSGQWSVASVSEIVSADFSQQQVPNNNRFSGFAGH